MTDIEEKIFYEDEGVRVNEKGVEILKYYFPVAAASKVIPWKEIKSIHTDEELNLDRLSYKGWGMGLSSIWWAWGPNRSQVFGIKPQTNLVIETHNAWPRCGFEVHDLPNWELVKMLRRGVQMYGGGSALASSS
eukprot:TRINITY_DN3025_c0_g1_i1.p1 TRINITY_DN3025_c0_g1~~TRINITY_DN3025_c0_g1_i1.p1  ORF type:complete len:134 (-),score=22.22 TRINITY_DN3025_c0_g1_i1:147-548(-)